MPLVLLLVIKMLHEIGENRCPTKYSIFHNVHVILLVYTFVLLVGSNCDMLVNLHSKQVYWMCHIVTLCAIFFFLDLTMLPWAFLDNQSL